MCSYKVLSHDPLRQADDYFDEEMNTAHKIHDCEPGENKLSTKAHKIKPIYNLK